MNEELRNPFEADNFGIIGLMARPSTLKVNPFETGFGLNYLVESENHNSKPRYTEVALNRGPAQGIFRYQSEGEYIIKENGQITDRDITQDFGVSIH